MPQIRYGGTPRTVRSSMRRWLVRRKLPRVLALLMAASGAALCAQASAAEPWQFRLSPYAWLAGMKGRLGAGPGAPTAPIDVSPADVIDDIDAALMLTFDARKGRHGVFVDVFYADISSDAELLPPPIDLTARVGAESTVFTVAYQYEVYREGGTTAELLAGGRYWRSESVLGFAGGGGQFEGRRFRSRESWTDPLVGLKGRMPIGSSKFYLEGGASVGGFGVGSDLYYEGSALLAYQWTDAIALAAGYRYFDVEYDDDGFLYDVAQQGWQFGLSWSF